MSIIVVIGSFIGSFSVVAAIAALLIAAHHDRHETRQRHDAAKRGH